jgi:cobalt-zinc-cadmium efflux system protein
MHSHGHSHGGAHGGGHGGGHGDHVGNANERRVFWAMLLTAIFMGVEVAGGIISGSLALIADAGHMATDAAALGLAWGAFRIARRPADKHRSYGYDRFQVLAAFVNGLALLGLVGWILWEAIQRIATPIEIMAMPMLVVAVIGLLVNIFAYYILHAGAKDNINIEGALLHVLGDLLGSVATIVAAVVIMQTGWTPIDPILSVLVALLILKSGWHLVKRAAHILMEGTPETFDIDELKENLVTNVDGLKDVHHVHIWLLIQEKPLLTMHATIDEDADWGQVLLAIKSRLIAEYGIDHSTIQIEDGTCADH